MRIGLIILTSLLISQLCNGQKRAPDTLYYSIEKRDFVKKKEDNSPSFQIRNYTGKSKKNYVAKIIHSEKQFQTEFEVKKKISDGFYKSVKENKLKIDGFMFKNKRVGKWNITHLQDSINIQIEYGSRERAIFKKVEFGKPIKIYKMDEVDSLPVPRFAVSSFPVYISAITKMQKSDSLKADLKLLILDSGIIGDVELLRSQSNIDESKFRTFIKEIFFHDYWFPAKINGKLVHSELFMTIEMIKGKKPDLLTNNTTFWYPSKKETEN